MINNYEDRIRELNKELSAIRRDYENYQRRNESDRNKIIDDY